MKFSKVTKIITALVMIATIALALNMVFASTISIPSASNVSETGFNTTVSNILGIVTYICYAAAVIMLLMLGIKYITASPEGKAEIKKSAVIYVIGAVLVFAAATVLNIIKNLTPKIVVSQ